LGETDKFVKNERLELEIEFDEKFWLWSLRTAKTKDDYQARKNAQSFDRAFWRLRNRCMAPDCGYPLQSGSNNYAVPFIGEVCCLCHDMYKAVADRAFFVAAQAEADARRRRAKNN
jgi:hypothetical protein